MDLVISIIFFGHGYVYHSTVVFGNVVVLLAGVIQMFWLDVLLDGCDCM